MIRLWLPRAGLWWSGAHWTPDQEQAAIITHDDLPLVHARCSEVSGPFPVEAIETPDDGDEGTDLTVEPNRDAPRAD